MSRRVQAIGSDYHTGRFIIREGVKRNGLNMVQPVNGTVSHTVQP